MVKYAQRLLFVFVSVCVVPAWAGGHTNELISLGADLYDESCERCHGADADGLRGFDLTLAAFTDRLEGMTQEMPDFAGYFDEDELAAMHAYLTSVAESAEE